MSKKNRDLFLSSLSLALLGALVVSNYTESAQAAAFENGGFETGTEPGPTFITLQPGSTDIQGWIVNSGTIDYVNDTYWIPPQGTRSIDLNGTGPGSISQTFNTIVDGRGIISFELAGNPGGGPAIKTLEVTAPGFTGTYSFDTTGMTSSNMGWVDLFFFFPLTTNTATVTFRSTTLGDFGPAIDHVRFFQLSSETVVPEPLTILGSLTALSLGASLKRKLNKKP